MFTWIQSLDTDPRHSAAEKPQHFQLSENAIWPTPVRNLHAPEPRLRRCVAHLVAHRDGPLRVELACRHDLPVRGLGLVAEDFAEDGALGVGSRVLREPGRMDGVDGAAFGEVVRCEWEGFFCERAVGLVVWEARPCHSQGGGFVTRARVVSGYRRLSVLTAAQEDVRNSGSHVVLGRPSRLVVDV